MAKRSRQAPAFRPRPARRKGRRRSRLTPTQAVIWFTAGLGLGLAALAPFFLLGGDPGPAPEGERAAPVSEPSRPAPEPAEPTDARATDRKGKGGEQSAVKEGEASGEYRFYTLLPEMEVEVPPAPEPGGADGKTPGAPGDGDRRQPAGPPRAAPEGEFLLQVAAYRQAGPAEALKARLALQGLQARVVRAKLGAKGTWYRVRLGPYADRPAAEAVRDRVEREGLKPMIMRR